ncbi:WD40 repeat domain-containing serine/threonine-protein kinase [Calothrix sp. PCC 7507]|uniref:WD40 repeat domain-containing serine/threonine-protein kinase n=1 Tax=Calothrix sp. PCC 7507 TaxID=99598 RepID=UPI00029F09A1|nr:WD40 repeat domain-containing serine/threonine-protein kinase [Calothrix sp. PCC 7507]AFY32673.1 serine/threonine protein kinase with WD40 repeats [Calothrix sp. PCC 7507]
MSYCLNLNCWKPENPDSHKFCQNCGTKLIPLLKSRYQITKLIASGGLQRTYLAIDADRFNTQCFIKQFAPLSKIPANTDAFKKATMLFEQEARLLLELGQHPQIPSLLAYFEQDQYFYLVEEFVDGDNLLSELSQQGVFTEEKIQELLINLLAVIQFIHDRQVIHRDIKPENIIRCRSQGKFILIDFGVAQYLNSEIPDVSSAIFGTPGYASIEQMQGHKAAFADDLYSLGATCFHLLSGIHPYQLFIRYSHDWIPHWRQHLSHPVSVALGLIIDTLFRQKVTLGYQSAQDVIRDLQTQPHSISSIIPIIPALPTVPVVTSPAFHLPTTQIWRCIHTVTGDYGCNSIAISHDGQIFASSYHDKSIKIRNLYSGELRRILNEDSPSHFTISGLKISPDMQTIANFEGLVITGGSTNGVIKIRNVDTGKILHSLDCALAWGYDLKHFFFSPDSKLLTMSGGDEIYLWNLETGNRSLTLSHASSGWVHSLAFSPDGKILASGGGAAWRSWGSYEVGDPTIKLWNVSDGKLLSNLAGHSDSVLSIAFSSEILASGSADKTIKVWHFNSGVLLHTLTGHSAAVLSLAMSPDRKILASGSDDGTIKLWDISIGKLLYTLTGHADGVLSLAFLPEQNTLVSVCRDQTIKVWQYK